MGYFDGLADAAFKNDEEGNYLFYPFGVIGKGRVIPSENEKDSLRLFLKRTYQFFFLLFILLFFVAKWQLILGLLMIALFTFYFVLFKRIQSYEYATSKLTLKESLKNSAKSHNKLTLLFLFGISILFVLIGLGISTLGEASIVIGILCAAFFGLCAICIGYMLIARDS